MGALTWSIHVLQRTVQERLKQLRQTTSDSFSAEADDTKMQNSRNFKTTQMIGAIVQRSGDEMDCNPTEYYSIYRYDVRRFVMVSPARILGIAI